MKPTLNFFIAAAMCFGLCAPRLSAQPESVKPAASTDVPSPSAKDGEVRHAEIRKALRELESDQLAERDDAEKRLVEFGPASLPFLPQITARTSGETKVRLQRIRQALQMSKVETFFEASKVTLSGVMTLAEAVSAIQAQTGNTVELQADEGMGSTMIELDAQEQDFWPVMQRVMSQARLRINAFGTVESNLVLSPGGRTPNSSAPEAFTVGPFLVELSSVQARRVFNSPIDGQLDVSFQFAWEPRLKPVFMQIPMASLTATTADGKQLAAVNPQAAPEIALNLGGCATQVDLQIARPDRSVQRLDSLTGELIVAVPGDRHQYIFKKFGNGARQNERFGDVSVTLERAFRNGAVYEMRIMTEFGDAQGALESFRGWIMSNEAYLLDANDQRIENVGLNNYSTRGSNSIGMAYRFQINADPDDYRLVVESPGAITKQTIRYELKGIELP